MHQNKEKVWQMRVPCKSKTFLPDPTFETFVVLNSDLYIPYLREPDGAFGEVVTKRTLSLFQNPNRKLHDDTPPAA